MPEKLTITSYTDYDYSESIGQFEVLVNPEEYATSQQINYTNKQSLGSPGAEPLFQSIPSEECNFSILFDSTGVITTTPTSLKGKSIAEQIDTFTKVTSDYKGDLHRPPPLELVWGAFIFKGVLVDLNIKYNVFKPDGTPVRAIAEAKFKTAIGSQEAQALSKKSSPDMTHIKTFEASSSLQQFCQSIYSGENYFVQVAQANDLDHLRGSHIGQSLTFPPLKNK